MVAPIFTNSQFYDIIISKPPTFFDFFPLYRQTVPRMIK